LRATRGRGEHKNYPELFNEHERHDLTFW
jgi:hypothetical protein